VLDLERREESLVERLHQEGVLSIVRRPECSPLAVLRAAIGRERAVMVAA
jgi:hypothetical protein